MAHDQEIVFSILIGHLCLNCINDHPLFKNHLPVHLRSLDLIIKLFIEIARDATEIAFAALTEVAAGFSTDPANTRTSLDKARKTIDKRLGRSISANRFSSDEMGEAIGQTVGEVVPLIIGDIVGGAVRAAFTGDTARLEKMENLDKQIEAQVEPRAKQLGFKVVRVDVATGVIEDFMTNRGPVNGPATRVGGGEVVEVNPAVAEDVQVLSQDPYTKGWLIKVRVDSNDSFDGASGSGRIVRLRFRKVGSGSSRLDFAESHGTGAPGPWLTRNSCRSPFRMYSNSMQLGSSPKQTPNRQTMFGCCSSAISSALPNRPSPWLTPT